MTVHKRLGAPVAALLLSAAPLAEAPWNEARAQSGGGGISCPPGWSCDTNTGAMRRITDGTSQPNAAPQNAPQQNVAPAPQHRPVPTPEPAQVPPPDAAQAPSSPEAAVGDGIACPPGWMCNPNTGQMRRMGDRTLTTNASPDRQETQREKYERWRRERKARRNRRGGGDDD